MPQIFISYSRKDKDFVIKLHSQLIQDGHDVWIDWEDIPLTADWRREIKKGIDSSNNFIFIISPSSVQSQICREEVQYAADNNKRFVPVLYSPLITPEDKTGLHPVIGTHNWVMFDNQDNFQENYQRLVQTVTSGLEHVQEHTRFLIRAHEWQDSGKKDALLLDNRNLQLAQRWLKQSQGKTPQPTDLQREYIEISRKARLQSQVLRSVLSVVATIVSVFLIAVLGLVVLWAVIVAPYNDAIASLRERTNSFRVLHVPGLIELAADSVEGTTTQFVSLHDISEYVAHAALSIYDSRLYERSVPGLPNVIVALAQVALAGQTNEAASPISLLLAQNMVLDAEFVTDRDLVRQMEETLVALEIERTYSKSEMLEMLLNDLYFGNQNYGIEAASEWYFDTRASDLNVPEAAFLIGISVNPALYDPGIDVDEVFEQRDRILHTMLDVNCIVLEVASNVEMPFCIGSDAEVASDLLPQSMAVARAEIEARRYYAQSFALAAPHFANIVERELYELYGNQSFYNEALRVQTAFDPEIQAAAERVVAEAVEVFGPQGVNNAAFMATRASDGALLALVGSVDPTNSETGNAAFDWRDAGSIMHPVTYLATFSPNDEGEAWFPGTIVWDVPIQFNIDGRQYSPVNFDQRFRGPVSLRYALANSLNVPTFVALQHTGFQRFKDTIDAIGFRFPEGATIDLQSAIGANDVRLVDIATAYGTLANGGHIAKPHAILRIIDRRGRVIYEAGPPAAATISPDNAFLVTNILEDEFAAAPAFGLYRRQLGEVFSSGGLAIRPGTSVNGQSNWAVGYTPDIVGAFWMGNISGAPTSNVGGYHAALQWGEIMKVALLKYPPRPFSPPTTVRLLNICAITGTLLGDFPCWQTHSDYARVGVDPPRPEQGEILILNIHIPDGLIANEWCPENVETRTYLKTENPFVLDWIQNTQAGQEWAHRVGLMLPLVSPPTEFCTSRTGQ